MKKESFRSRSFRNRVMIKSSQQVNQNINDGNKQSFIREQQKQNQQQNQKQNAHSQISSDDDKYYRDNNEKFDLSSLKSKNFDLKAQWLGNTDEVLRKFQEKLIQVQQQKHQLKKGFQLFQQNQKKYKRNSLRKISFEFDKKQIYLQFMQKSRKPIQKLNPGLLLNIGSYVQRNIFYFLGQMRRVSKIFNFMYKNEEVTNYLSEKDLGEKQNRKNMQTICKRWIEFERTFLYYKQIKYTDQIPPNSFKNDLENGVIFINDIHKRIFKTNNFDIGYFRWVNVFMKVHRIIIALSTLSLTNLIMIRKPSIVAFSNYLALNHSQRKREQITKTRYHQVIKVVQDQDYRDCLIINTKVSNYLEEQYQFDFSVFILHSLTGKIQPNGSFLDQLYTYNIIMFHKHNDLKSQFVRNIELIQGNTLDTDIGLCIKFPLQKNLQKCQFSLVNEQSFEKIEMIGTFMNCLIRDDENNIKFSQCFVYNSEYLYIIVIRNLLENMPVFQDFQKKKQIQQIQQSKTK